MAPALMFHHFHDQVHPQGQGSLSGSDLYDLINNNSRIISADEWYRLYQSNNLRDETCITFDDNLRSQFDVALPILEQLNLKAFWFIYTSPLVGEIERIELYRYYRTTCFPNINAFYNYFDIFIEQSKYKQEVEEKLNQVDINKHLNEWPFYAFNDKKFRYIRDNILGTKKYFEIVDAMIRDSDLDTESVSAKLWMTSENIKTLHRSGHFIGLHSHTHPTKLEDLKPNQIQQEYETNKTILENIIGKGNIFSMSHPCNSYKPVVFDILKHMDIEIGFRSNNSIINKPSSYELPRIDHTLILRK